MKVAIHSILRAGQEEAYEQAHATIPGEMADALQAAGISDWLIWRSGRDLFHLIDCDDFTAAMAKLGEDPVNERWQERMAFYVESFAHFGGEPDGLALREVWTLTGQLSGGSAAAGEA
jgi:L-rhamnose mutarotase